eukprot:Awhi_evm1s11863
MCTNNSTSTLTMGDLSLYSKENSAVDFVDFNPKVKRAYNTLPNAERLFVCEFKNCDRKYSTNHSRRQHYRKIHNHYSTAKRKSRKSVKLEVKHVKNINQLKQSSEYKKESKETSEPKELISTTTPFSTSIDKIETSTQIHNLKKDDNGKTSTQIHNLKKDDNDSNENNEGIIDSMKLNSKDENNTIASANQEQFFTYTNTNNNNDTNALNQDQMIINPSQLLAIDLPMISCPLIISDIDRDAFDIQLLKNELVPQQERTIENIHKTNYIYSKYGSSPPFVVPDELSFPIDEFAHVDDVNNMVNYTNDNNRNDIICNNNINNSISNSYSIGSNDTNILKNGSYCAPFKHHPSFMVCPCVLCEGQKALILSQNSMYVNVQSALQA